ncbi:hypothetical protein NX059_012294 [Plenodomus lindquistii]|nr:hypothetical protein NX059_012294 [Plenodomus lindquistii]
MATSTRDLTIILRDFTDYTGWYSQLQFRAIAYGIWEKIDPKSTTVPHKEPVAPEAPEASGYTPGPNIETPLRPSDLSQSGLKAYKEDLEYYKVMADQYKTRRHIYEREQNGLQQIIAFIQSTVTPHLLRTCCLPDNSVREWLSRLKATVGVDEAPEQKRARDRYNNALKPMRSTAQWDTWLAEYDQAATEAETYSVPEATQAAAVMEDFLTAVNKQAPIWATQFHDSGRHILGMTRKEMMKRFWEHMMMKYPLKGKSKANFATCVETTPAAEVNPHQDSTRDASTVENATSKDQGRPRNQRGNNYRKRQAERSIEAPSSGANCAACGQRHDLKDCFYLHKEKAPKWWKPNGTINELVTFRQQNDPEFQGLIRSQSRPRTGTPAIKQSHTPTPEVEWLHGQRISSVEASFNAAGSLSGVYPLQNSYTLDSGTTCIITNDPQRIYDYRAPGPPGYVWAGNTQV